MKKNNLHLKKTRIMENSKPIEANTSNHTTKVTQSHQAQDQTLKSSQFKYPNSELSKHFSNLNDCNFKGLPREPSFQSKREGLY